MKKRKKYPVSYIDVKVPVNDEVGPQVADHPGDLPVEEGEVEDAGREQVDQLVTMSNAPVDHVIGIFENVLSDISINIPWNRISRNATREEKVPKTWSSVVLERVEVGLGVAKVVELHELVG